MVYFLQGPGIVDHDEAFLLGAIHPAHQDDSVIFFCSVRVGNKDWFCGEMSIWELLDEESSIINVELHYSAVKVEGVLCHVWMGAGL